MKKQMDKNRCKVPNRFALSRARLRLDAVAMLMRRVANREDGWRRQLFYDASPQKNIELFAIREWCHQHGDVKGGTYRRLPLTTLGLGHFHQEDKALCVIHSTAMETGLETGSIRHFNYSVRVNSPDSGHERAAVDFLDFVLEYLAGPDGEPLEEEADRTFLYPYAFWLPEGNHVWDLVARLMMNSIPWFEEYFALLRQVVAFFRGDSRRNLIDWKLKANGSAQAVHFKDAPESPFELRWGRSTMLQRIRR